MEMELILFSYCPYGQRSRITLLHNKTPHKVTLIDPDNLPGWFKDVSPLGKVPIARIAGEDAIFESAVINELADQMGNNDLLPQDPVKRARARAWIEFGSTCQMNFGGMLRAEDEETFEQANEELLDNLSHIEDQVNDTGPFFLGENFSLVDSTYAPLFSRLEHLNKTINCYPKDNLPRVAAWSKTLCALPEVSASVDDDLPAAFSDLVAHLGPKGYVARQMGLTRNNI